MENPRDEAVRRFIHNNYLTQGNDALQAILDIGRLYGVAVAYIYRDNFDQFAKEERETPLTEEEWGRIAGHLDFTEDYDEFVANVHNGDDGYVHNSFMRQVMDDVGIPGPDGEKWSRS